MKKIFLHLLIIGTGITLAICNTSCKNEYEDMLPNEVRFDGSVDHSGDKIRDIK